MPVAYNQETGEAVMLDPKGAWVPTKIATNKEGARLAFDGKDWTPLGPAPKAEPEEPAQDYSRAWGGLEPKEGESITNSPVGGILRGGRDVLDAGAQLLTRSIETGAKYLAPDSKAAKWATGQRENVEKINKGAEQDYEQNWHPDKIGGIDPGRLIGNMAATAPLSAVVPGAAAATLLPRVASGAAIGGMSGALQPVDTEKTPDFWNEKAKQTGTSAALGGVFPVAGAALSRVVSPNASLNPQVQKLIEAGATPTPGQALGGAANRLEESLQSVPIVGDVVRSARQRVMEKFNRAVYNKALAPIGETLDEATPLGREAVEEAANKVSAKYDALVPQLSVKADQPFLGQMQVLRGMAQNLHPDRAKQFESILDREVISKFSNGATMTGESFKETESALGRIATQYRNSAVGDERQLGDAITQIQSNLRQLLMRSNPDKAVDLAKINQAYGNLLRVQTAAGRIGAEEGNFTPAQLLSSVRQLDPSLRKSAFAKGNAKMQDFAEAGKTVLGNKVPDSGTAERWGKGLGGLAALGGLFHFNPVAAGAAAGAGAATMGAYAPGLNPLITRMLASRPQGAQDVANTIKGLSPYAGLAAPLSLSP